MAFWSKGRWGKNEASASRRRPRTRNTYRPFLEALESRELLSAPPSSITVHPGDSIQAAVDSAAPGTTIYILPGVYKQTVNVATPGIQLIGVTGADGSRAVLKNPGSMPEGITVNAPADGFVLQNLVITGFATDGLFMQHVNDYRVEDVTAVHDGEHGLFPIACNHGVITGCTATESSDIGIYVGQSLDVNIFNNTIFGNVNGIEVEDSSYVNVVSNNVYNNVAGIVILVFPETDLSGYTGTTATNNLVQANHVHENNHFNFGAAGSLQSFEPSGSGILIVGADSSVVSDNLVTGNNFTGIGVLDTQVLAQLANLPPHFLDGIDTTPDLTHIDNNTVVGNGSHSPIPTIPGADLLWDGSGTNNDWSGNIYHTVTSPIPLP